MGNNSSRQRTRPQPQHYPPPPGIYQQQILPPYYHDPQIVNNGHHFGANMWRPPYPPPAGAFPPPAQFRPPGGAPPHAPHVPAPSQELTQTATIRNAVNLKKNTLSLVPLESDPRRLAIRFDFDASEACSVTTFVVATEEPSKACQLTPSKQPLNEAVLYEKGLGLKFPKAGAPEAVIDTGAYEERQLTAADKDTYPLVIRMETVTDKGRSDAHTLQELRPGASQKVWVQSQTTFAALARDEEGRWFARVLKQKIWVEGVSYELQEIYGMENSAAAPMQPEKEGAALLEENEERLCVICLVNERDTTVLPCRHMCMCQSCSQELRKQTSKCPICRNHVESLLHIKMHKAAAAPKPPVDSTAAVADAVRDLKLL